MKYQLQHLLRLPFIGLSLPLLYLQGRHVKRTIPRLPEARDPEGEVIVENSTPLRLLFLGESTVAGVGLERHVDGLPGTLANRLSEQLNRSIQWEVVAKSGYTVTKVNDRLLPQLADKPADQIIIGLGGNDAFALRSPWRWRRDISKLLTNLRKQYPDTPILFANMPPIHIFPAFTSLMRWVLSGQVRLLGKALAQEVKQHDNVSYANELIDLEVWKERHKVDGKITDFFSDGVHPSPLTYRVWAQDLARWIPS